MNDLDLINLMKEKAEAVQVVVQEVDDLNGACRYAVDLTKQQNGATLAAVGWNSDCRSILQKYCREAGLDLVEENLRHHADHIHTGFTPADWGLAATGTLVLESSGEDLRIATMLAETHIAVLPVSRLKFDTYALEEELDRLMHSPPRYLAFITGASRTADIERVLTIGVHGPQELHLLLLKD